MKNRHQERILLKHNSLTFHKFCAHALTGTGAKFLFMCTENELFPSYQEYDGVLPEYINSQISFFLAVFKKRYL